MEYVKDFPLSLIFAVEFAHLLPLIANLSSGACSSSFYHNPPFEFSLHIILLSPLELSLLIIFLQQPTFRVKLAHLLPRIFVLPDFGDKVFEVDEASDEEAGKSFRLDHLLRLLESPIQLLEVFQHCRSSMEEEEEEGEREGEEDGEGRGYLN